MRSVRGFDDLEPIKRGLQNIIDRDEVLKLICPPHEARPKEMRVRAGISKTGRYCYFERRADCDETRMWMPGLEMSLSRFQKIRALYESRQIRAENGPYGCFLFFSVHENAVA